MSQLEGTKREANALVAVCAAVLFLALLYRPPACPAVLHSVGAACHLLTLVAPIMANRGCVSLLRARGRSLPALCLCVCLCECLSACNSSRSYRFGG
jgi:hypothetical protein